MMYLEDARGESVEQSMGGTAGTHLGSYHQWSWLLATSGSRNCGRRLLSKKWR